MDLDKDIELEEDIDDIDVENYKGIFYNDDTNKYTDPVTGAHFEYSDICNKLKNIANNNNNSQSLDEESSSQNLQIIKAQVQNILNSQNPKNLKQHESRNQNLHLMQQGFGISAPAQEIKPIKIKLKEENTRNHNQIKKLTQPTEVMIKKSNIRPLNNQSIKVKLGTLSNNNTKSKAKSIESKNKNIIKKEIRIKANKGYSKTIAELQINLQNAVKKANKLKDRGRAKIISSRNKQMGIMGRPETMVSKERNKSKLSNDSFFKYKRTFDSEEAADVLKKINNNRNKKNFSYLEIKLYQNPNNMLKKAYLSPTKSITNKQKKGMAFSKANHKFKPSIREIKTSNQANKNIISLNAKNKIVQSFASILREQKKNKMHMNLNLNSKSISRENGIRKNSNIKILINSRNQNIKVGKTSKTIRKREDNHKLKVI